MNEEHLPLVLGDGENTLELRRSSNDAQLVAVLRTPDLTARERFEAEAAWGGFKELAVMLSGLADDWRGFDGVRSWASSDGVFRIRCTHDRMRSVRADVRLLHLDDWEVELPIALELGGLDHVKANVLRFFAFAME